MRLHTPFKCRLFCTTSPLFAMAKWKSALIVNKNTNKGLADHLEMVMLTTFFLSVQHCYSSRSTWEGKWSLDMLKILYTERLHEATWCDLLLSHVIVWGETIVVDEAQQVHHTLTADFALFLLFICSSLLFPCPPGSPPCIMPQSCLAPLHPFAPHIIPLFTLAAPHGSANPDSG